MAPHEWCRHFSSARKEHKKFSFTKRTNPRKWKCAKNEFVNSNAEMERNEHQRSLALNLFFLLLSQIRYWSLSYFLLFIGQMQRFLRRATHIQRSCGDFYAGNVTQDLLLLVPNPCVPSSCVIVSRAVSLIPISRDSSSSCSRAFMCERHLNQQKDRTKMIKTDGKALDGGKGIHRHKTFLSREATINWSCWKAECRKICCIAGD